MHDVYRRLACKLILSVPFANHQSYDSSLDTISTICMMHDRRKPTKRLCIFSYCELYTIFFSSACLCQQGTVVVQVSVVRPSLNLGFSQHGSRSNFMDSSLSTISPGIFFFKIFNFQKFLRFFFSFSLAWGPMGAKKFQTLLLLQFLSNPNQTLL